MVDALFREVDGWFVPGELTRGPWQPDAMHGGPPAAMIGWGIEQALEPGEQAARIAVDLITPVPLEPLRVVSVRRPVSRRVTHLDVELVTERATVCTAHAVLLRGDPLPRPTWSPPAVEPPAGPEHRDDIGPAFHDVTPVYHRDAVEHRVVAGSITTAGPATSWSSLRYPLVAGRATPPLAALLAVADFGSAIAQPYGWDEPVLLINVDVSVALSRSPAGEWFRLDAVDLVGDAGIAVAVTHLADEAGPLGVLHQSQLGRRR